MNRREFLMRHERMRLEQAASRLQVHRVPDNDPHDVVVRAMREHVITIPEARS
jgi:hypothetical protein